MSMSKVFMFKSDVSREGFKAHNLLNIDIEKRLTGAFVVTDDDGDGDITEVKLLDSGRTVSRGNGYVLLSSIEIDRYFTEVQFLDKDSSYRAVVGDVFKFKSQESLNYYGSHFDVNRDFKAFVESAATGLEIDATDVLLRVVKCRANGNIDGVVVMQSGEEFRSPPHSSLMHDNEYESILFAGTKVAQGDTDGFVPMESLGDELVVGTEVKFKSSSDRRRYARITSINSKPATGIGDGVAVITKLTSTSASASELLAQDGTRIENSGFAVITPAERQYFMAKVPGTKAEHAVPVTEAAREYLVLCDGDVMREFADDEAAARLYAERLVGQGCNDVMVVSVIAKSETTTKVVLKDL